VAHFYKEGRGALGPLVSVFESPTDITPHTRPSLSLLSNTHRDRKKKGPPPLPLSCVGFVLHVVWWCVLCAVAVRSLCLCL